ncbi:MAG: hypothetical protein WEE89_06525 [Gemmatimonadota bacterium]
MKINSVRANNRLKAFEVRAGRRVLRMPFARLPVQPTSDNRITQLYVDPEMGREGFTYVLEDGQSDSLHLDAVLDYNADPGLLSRLFLYELTSEARNAVEASGISRREIARRLDTSLSQLYRLLDTTNDKKSIGQLLSLLSVLDFDVKLEITPRVPAKPAHAARKRRGRSAA